MSWPSPRLLLVAVAGAFFAVACTRSDAEPPVTNLPANAIRISPDFYMIPLKETFEGCPIFRAFSPGRMVTQIIYYRAGDDSFTTDHGQAVDCDKDAVNQN